LHLLNLESADIGKDARVTISAWTAAHIRSIERSRVARVPIVTRAQARPIVPGLDLWDMWPVCRLDGGVAEVAGGVLWMALSAPVMGDPGLRHFSARIRLIHQIEEDWRDCGDALPDGHCPGNREWAGSAILDPGGRITLFVTAAGAEGQERGYQQRLFQTSADLRVVQGRPRLEGWAPCTESVAADGDHYVVVDQAVGEPGKIKAFRDPFVFRDPADGRFHLLFTGSLARSGNAFNGCIGIARANDNAYSAWTLQPPLVHADGLNNELERPHMIVRDGLYYLFWSTQRGVFAPEGPDGPTGLYGMVAPSLCGPYVPLNGSGLVLANPEEEPTQTYSWMVMDDLRVTSFVDAWGTVGRAFADADEARAHFGGTPAPFVRIALDGETASLVLESGGSA
jgi:levansucrase